MTYNHDMACDCQAAYAKDHNLPHFAPITGYCWRCGRDIYDKDDGFSVEEAATRLITYCPRCHRSFND